jgi:hypothetical protein
MSAAYEKACRTMTCQAQADIVKELLAKRIIEVARQGHIDPDVIYKRALKAFGFDRVRSETSEG